MKFDVDREHSWMSAPDIIHSVDNMDAPTTLVKTLNWPLILGLGALALIRPLVRIFEDRSDLDLSPWVPIAMTLCITIIWIAAVGLTRVRQPLLTLVCTGLTYGILATVLSAILSPILIGHLDGPLARPIAIIPMLIVNAIWGLIAGAIASAIQRARGVE
ncbi:hypothetical protein [Nocardia sp. NPDC047654]|uniref:hypothetical protein n=1 Tax=Nocardia sp. NPDC047654 TaxID=3364314 RepID=UPI003723453A